MNMTKDQINECFDMDTLRRGVKKQNLPQYVHLDKLRQYFSDAQLRDFIDLDFFKNATQEDHFKMKSSLAPLGASTLTAPTSRPRKPVVSVVKKPAPRHLQRKAPSLAREIVVEERHREKAFEEAIVEKVSDGFGREMAADRFDRERVSEDVFRDSDLGVSFDAGDEEGFAFLPDDVRRGIIWNEILTQPPIVQAYKRAMTMGGAMPPPQS